MQFTKQHLESLYKRVPTYAETVELIEGYERQRNKLAEQNHRIEILQEALLDANHRNTELDLQRRLAQSKLSKVEKDFWELKSRMDGLEK